MGEVISFQKALEKREGYLDNKYEIDSILIERSQAFLEFYTSQAELDFLKESYPTLSMFFNVVNQTFRDSRFERSFSTLGGVVEPDTNIITPESTLINCLRLFNSYSGKDYPKDSATVFSLGTKDGMKSLMKFDVETFLTSSEPLNLHDVKEVRTIFFDYLGEHPDIDTERDVVGQLSVLSYHAIGVFLENGYIFSRYIYELINQPEKHRYVPTPIIMEFTKENNEPIYLYFDHEAVMRSFEALVDEILGGEKSA